VLQRLDEWHVRGFAVEHCSITAPVRVSRPRVPPAGVFAWRGELVPCVSLWGSSSIGEALRSCGAPDPTFQPPRVGPTLVGGENYSCERVVRGGDSSCEQVVGGEAETCRARRRLLKRGGDSSCGMETCRAMRRLVGRSRDSLCEMETCRARRRLVREATHWSEMRCLASDGLDKDM
jgi:hypothetical protein